MIEEPKALTVLRTRRRPTEAQIAAFQDVPTGFIVDALGGTGAMEPGIRPLGEGRDLPTRMAGPALTADCGPADILALFGSLGYIQPGDIVVAAVHGFRSAAITGDRVAGMMKNAGAAGFVTDGPVRDYEGIAAVGLPMWCTGLTPATPFSNGPGRVGFAVDLAGLRVESGDMIVADFDGVVVVPFARIDEVVEALPRIAELEAALDARVAAGQIVHDKIRDMLDNDGVAFVD